MSVFLTKGEMYRHNRIAPKGGTGIPPTRPGETLIPVASGTWVEGEKRGGQNALSHKMGFCELTRDNVITHVAANEQFHSGHLNVRRHAEYLQMPNGDVYFVNKRGQIGLIRWGAITWLFNAPNYYSWNAGVEPHSGFESVSIPCDKYTATATLYDPGNDAVKHSQGFHTLKRPFGRANGNLVGFQTDDNECVIFINGRLEYREEYDGRRFPVAYNYRDGMFVDFRHPDRDGAGACQSLWSVPALNEYGKIVWTMPPNPVVYDPALSYDGSMVNEGKHPSPVPVLNSIPLNLSLVWHWWTAYSAMSIVKSGLVDHPHTEPGYYATGYKRYFSYCLVRQGRCPPEPGDEALEGGGGCSRYDFTGSYFGDVDASKSTFKGIRTQDQIESNVALKVSDVTPLCVDTGLWLMTVTEQTTGSNCPSPPLEDVPRQQPLCSKDTPIPCGKYPESMAVRAKCTHYDFPPEVPLHNQIRGFACEILPDDKIRIVTRQKLFTCIQESRRVTNTPIIGEPPKPLPLNWSLAKEINTEELSYEVFSALDHDDRNRLAWWQKYIETFYLYQSQPLAAHLVQIFDDTQILIPKNCEYHIDPISGNRVLTKCYDKNGNEISLSTVPSNTPSGWTKYGQPDFGFFDYVNEVGQRQFMQITSADTSKPGCYIPLWMHFKRHVPKVTTQRDVVDEETEEKLISHPLPWYTFRFDKLEDINNENERYYTAVINRHIRGLSIPTTIPDGVSTGGKELEYTTFTKDVKVPRKDSEGKYVLDTNGNAVLDTKTKTMSVLETPAVSSNFTGDSDMNAIYGLVPYDVVGVAKESSRPPSCSAWYMYDGAQLARGGNNYQEYLDYSRQEHNRVISTTDLQT